MIRITLELNEVVVAGTKYLSDMSQETINKYTHLYVESHCQWFPVECLNDLYDATKDTPDDAAECTFIKVPTVPGIKSLRERIWSRYPSCKIEQVENLNWKN